MSSAAAAVVGCLWKQSRVLFMLTPVFSIGCGIFVQNFYWFVVFAPFFGWLLLSLSIYDNGKIKWVKKSGDLVRVHVADGAAGIADVRGVKENRVCDDIPGQLGRPTPATPRHRRPIRRRLYRPKCGPSSWSTHSTRDGTLRPVQSVAYGAT